MSTARPGLTIALCLVLAAVGIFYTARGLTFQTSSVELLPPQRVYVQRFKEYLRDFGELNDIVVVVEAPSVERAQDFADRLVGAIKTLPGAGRVSHRVDPDMFKGRALLYLPLERLRELRDQIVEHRRFIEQYAGRPTVAGLLDGLAEEIGRRFALGFIDLGLDGGSRERFDPGFIDALLGVIADGLDGRGLGSSPWERVFTASGGGRSGYFLSADKQLLFILVEPRRDGATFTDNEEFIARIRSAIGTLRQEHPDVRAGVTGTPALANDEMLRSFHDSTVATVIACVLTLGLLLVVFRRVVEPLVMAAVLAVSLAWTLAIVTATVGHLTVFSVMFISLLVGIGIDYGIYVLFRYEEELGFGRTPRQALDATASLTGPGILFGALAAAGTFAVLILTDFRGIQEFGVIAGTAILMAFLAMMTLFPAALVALGRRRAAPVRGTAAPADGDGVPWLERLLRHPTPILVVAVALTAGSAAVLPAVRFDYDRLALQARGSEAVVWERRIMESRRSGFAALASADSLAELRDKQAAFERLPAVADVTSLLALIPRDQEEKIAVIRELAPALARVRVGSASEIDPAALRRALEVLHRRLGIAVQETDAQTTGPAVRSARDRAGALLARLSDGDAGQLRARIAPIQALLRDDFGAKLGRLQENLAPGPITAGDLPDELTRKFVGRSGRFLMQIYPAINTWGREGAEEFVRQLRTVDPAVTGAPVISYEAGHLIQTAYFQGTLYAFVLAAALAVAMLRRARDALLALLPLALGTLWTIGAMRLFGLSFNLANVWALPLIVGASAEYGLNVALRYREGAAFGRVVLPASTVMAVLLNGLTTVAGFGSLMAASHQGIFGLGLLLTIGTAAGLATSLAVLPVLLRILDPAPSATSAEPAIARQ